MKSQKTCHVSSRALAYVIVSKKAPPQRCCKSHMAGVAGLEPTHAGFRDPCLTNLAIPLCLPRSRASTINIIAGKMETVKHFFRFFGKSYEKVRCIRRRKGEGITFVCLDKLVYGEGKVLPVPWAPSHIVKQITSRNVWKSNKIVYIM